MVQSRSGRPRDASLGCKAGKRGRTRGLVTLALGLWFAGGCGPGVPSARSTVDAFVEAVQAKDEKRLFCLYAGVAQSDEWGADLEDRRRNFEEFVRHGHQAYEQGRDEGLVEIEGNEIALVKLFALGRGTFYVYGPVGWNDDGSLTLRMTLRFGYRHVDLSHLSPGTTFYLCGAPPGRVHPVRVPRGSREVTEEVLDHVAVDWTLVRAEPSEECPEPWAVVAAQPVEGSAETSIVTWKF